jgi:hypothetical protein
MKALGYLAVLVGVVLVAYVLTQKREGFVSEFLEQGNVRRTAETATSSYAQQTNHFIMTKPLAEQPRGIETPFRVNQFNSFMPA